MIRAIGALFHQEGAAAQAAAKRWKLAAIVLGAIAVLLAIGLIVALATR
jgi:CHASE3 domain sensor protein